MSYHPCHTRFVLRQSTFKSRHLSPHPVSKMNTKNTTVLLFLHLLPLLTTSSVAGFQLRRSRRPIEEIIPPIEPIEPVEHVEHITPTELMEPVPPAESVIYPPRDPPITKDAANKPQKRGSLFAQVSLGFPEWRSLPF